MSISKITRIAMLSAALALASTSAFATDGTLSFSGAITGSTCQINTSANAAALAVSLPTVSVSSLASAGSVAGRTPFSIALSNCTTSVTKVQTYFEAGPTINSATNNLALQGSGSAANVEVQLLNTDQSKILLGNTLATQNSATASVSHGNANLSYYAQYYATAAAASSGTANTSVTFTMVYQ